MQGKGQAGHIPLRPPLAALKEEKASAVARCVVDWIGELLQITLLKSPTGDRSTEMTSLHHPCRLCCGGGCQL